MSVFDFNAEAKEERKNAKCTFTVFRHLLAKIARVSPKTIYNEYFFQEVKIFFNRRFAHTELFT